ncbi:hypothetical protein QTP86_010504 [Hemibagrus guttatus]|nr:hypothetical protein QTP86_010504 [Hemibagrus guttatus]
MGDGYWRDASYQELRYFICYNANFSGAARFIGITTLMTWPHAQAYCRTHHTDLASALNSSDNNFILQIRNIQGDSWIGLYRDTWKWSDGTIASNLPWGSGEPDNYGGVENCAIVFKGLLHDVRCTNLYYFFCHTILPVREQQIVRLQVKSDGSVLDPAVQSSILEQYEFHTDWSKPGLTTTAISAVDLQGADGNWATVGRRSRGGRRVRRQREKRKGKTVGLRIGTLNVGTMTGKGRELADMMEIRKVDILCVQETRWKGSKARSIGAGFKLFYYGVDSKRNGVGVVLKEEFVRNVLEVKRVSDRVMSLKLEIEGVMLNVVSGYAPQVGCELEEKERFWSELDEVMESIPTGERVVIGADFNGHVGEGNTGDEEVMGKFGVKERNLEGQMVVDFAKRMDMAVVNTYFQKKEEHRVTYKSGGRRTQVD